MMVVIGLKMKQKMCCNSRDGRCRGSKSDGDARYGMLVKMEDGGYRWLT